MPVPSLSEVTNVPVDAERATGNAGVVYDHGNLISQLNQSAQHHADNQWRTYNLFLGNLKEVYKDLNEIAKQPVMTEDRDKIKGDLSSIFKDISADPKSYFSGGPKFNEIQGRLAKLQTDATESKQNSLWDTAHREFFYRHPELRSDDNVSLIDNYRKQPLGSRQPYIMKLAGLFDPEEMSKGINDLVKSDYADSQVTPDGQFIQGIKGTKYDPAKYSAIADALYNQGDKNGTPLSKTIAERFNKLPQYIKDKYKGQPDPAKAYYLELMELYRKPDQMTKDELKPNPGYLEKEKLALDKKRVSVAMGHLGLDREKFNYAKEEDKYGAMSVLNEARDIIGKGQEVKIDRDGKQVKVLRIGDPNLLKSFGSIDKDGNVTNVPDVLEYDRDKNQIRLGYYSGDKTESGKNQIVKEVTLDQRTWLKEIAKRSFPNKDIGKVNTLVDDILNENGNSLYSLTQKSNAKNSAAENIPSYSKSDLLKAGWSEAQIKEATSAGKIKVN